MKYLQHKTKLKLKAHLIKTDGKICCGQPLLLDRYEAVDELKKDIKICPACESTQTKMSRTRPLLTLTKKRA